MVSYKGWYLNGKDLHINYAEVYIYPDGFKIIYKSPSGEEGETYWPIQAVDEHMDRSGSRLILKRKEQPHERLEFADDSILAAMRSTFSERQFKTANRNKGLYTGLKLFLIIFGSIAAVIFLLYILFVPWAAKKAAEMISIEQEESIGEQFYKQSILGQNIDKEKTKWVQNYFDSLHYKTPFKVKITVVDDKMVNAFAMPGGYIVVMTGLLEKMKSHEELAALLGHELTHINEHHVTQSIFRQGGVYLLFGVIFNDISELGALVIEGTEQLKSLSFSRELEEAADKGGYTQMKDQKLNPNGMTGLFKTLKSAGGPEISSFISTHPATDDRLKATEKWINDEHPAFIAHPELEKIFIEINRK